MRHRFHRRHAARRRAAASLLEVTVGLCIIGVLVGIALPRVRGMAARNAARAAAREVGLLLAAGRQVAATSASGAAVRFDTAGARVTLLARGDTLRTLELRAIHGVTLRATRDSLAWDSRGLGLGAANLRVTLSRGVAAETVVISRLGRVRGVRW